MSSDPTTSGGADPPPAPPQSPRPIALLVGFSNDEATALARHLGADGVTAPDGEPESPVEVEAVDPEEVPERLRDGSVAVLCLGRGLSPSGARDLLDRIAPSTVSEHGTAGPDRAPEVVILSAGPDAHRFQRAIDRNGIHFLCREPPEPEDQALLVASAVRAWHGLSSPAPTGPGARLRDPVPSEILDRLALQTEAGDAAELLAEAAREVVDASNAWCLLYDRRDDTLWTPEREEGGERRDSAAVGLASFVARCGRPVRVDRLDADPRHDQEADAPGGDGRERFVAVPADPFPTAGGAALGVLVAVREGSRPPFDSDDADALALLARYGAPFLERVSDTEPELIHEPAASGSARSLFRREALESWTRPGDEHGDPLRISPPWIRWGFRAMVAALLATLAFLFLAKTGRHVSGEAFVREVSPTPRIVILLPGHALPRLEAGMEGRFRLEGFGAVGQPFTVRTVHRELTSRSEALEGLAVGTGSRGAGGPLAVAGAALASPTFEADGDRYSYTEGMRGTAEVRMGEERLLFALIPGLRALGGGDRD